MRTAVMVALALALLAARPAVGADDNTVDAELFFKAGLMHLREGRTPMALEQFKKAVKADPKNPYAQKGLGLAYLRLGKFDEAVEAFRKALEINPYYVDVHNDLGTALMMAGRREEGKAEFTTAFNDPTNPTPEVSARNLGQAYQDEGNMVEAANWYRTSTNRNKLYPDAYLGLADSLLALNKVDEAVAYLETGAKELPKNACVLAALGQVYFRAGRLADARTRLEEADRAESNGPCGQRARETLKSLATPGKP